MFVQSKADGLENSISPAAKKKTETHFHDVGSVVFREKENIIIVNPSFWRESDTTITHTHTEEVDIFRVIKDYRGNRFGR